MNNIRAHGGVLRGVCALVVLAQLAGCAPLDGESALRFPFAAGWQTASHAKGTLRPMDNAQWWNGFADHTLDAFVARGLRGSPDLAAARARQTAANAAARAVPGAISLTGGASVEATDSNSSELSSDLGLEILFDPGRGRDAARRGARAGAGLAEAEAAGARLFLIGEIVDSYLSLRHAQQRLGLARSEQTRLRQTLNLARTMETAGEATRIDTLRSEARIASLEARIPALEAAVAKEKITLALLVGDAPGRLPPDLEAALNKGTGQPRARLAPDPGVPADLIRNRPDIRAAEASYDVARAGLGRARAALYPSLSLSGTIEATRTLDTGTSATTLSLGPSLRLPVLPQGPTRAGIAAASAGVEAAHADWTSRVLRALAEVESALLDYRAAARSDAAADRAVSLYTQTRTLTREVVSSGDATLSDLIAVEEALAVAETARADQRLIRAQAFAQLNLRLGAGSAAPVSDSQAAVAPAPMP